MKASRLLEKITRFVVKVNVEPFPSSLVTHIEPPFFSMNSFVSNNPIPEPFSSCVPKFEKCVWALNNFFRSLDFIPTPESVTEIST